MDRRDPDMDLASGCSAMTLAGLHCPLFTLTYLCTVSRVGLVVFSRIQPELRTLSEAHQDLLHMECYLSVIHVGSSENSYIHQRQTKQIVVMNKNSKENN